jgi:transposase
MGHRTGESRQQVALFPMMLDELVAHDSLVRVVDAWVNSLDMKALRFEKAQAQVMGAPPYDPADLLKLYIWGYLGGVRSTRRLEQQCHSNVECMWLLGRLAPDHKTIANFRRNSAGALVAACAAFVAFARSQRLISGVAVAIDGSKVRAVASRKAVLGQRGLAEQARRNAQEIEHYLKLLDEQDLLEVGQPRAQGDVQQALEQLRNQQAEIQGELERLAQERRTTRVQGEDDARVMPSLHSAPGYNLQTAVDTDSHLIVANEVVNDVTDQRQLKPMAEAAVQALGEPCAIVADAGYANGEHIAALQDKGLTSYVAVNRSVNHHGEGLLYERSAFSYDSQADAFTCPAGKTLARNGLDGSGKLVMYMASARDCGGCPHKPQCTTAKRRSVSRHIHEEALQANARRVERHPEMLVLRRCTVEHPFDFIKNRVLGNARLLMRGLDGARAELSIAVLAYNLKRMFNMKGGAWMHQALQG